MQRSKICLNNLDKEQQSERTNTFQFQNVLQAYHYLESVVLALG